MTHLLKGAFQAEFGGGGALLEVHTFDEISSTMDGARAIIREPESRAPDFVIETGVTLPVELVRCVVARSQSAGRGRKDRQWSSERDHGVYLTLSLNSQREVASLAGVPIAIGTSLCRELRRLTGSDAVTVKWPNDLMLTRPIASPAKIGGILTEVVGGELLIGIGLNVLASSKDSHPSESVPKRYDVLSLSEVWRGEGGVPTAAARVVRGALLGLESFFAEGLEPSRLLWSTLSAMDGYRVTVEGGRVGRPLGLSEEGGLIVELEGERGGGKEVITVLAGDVFLLDPA